MDPFSDACMIKYFCPEGVSNPCNTIVYSIRVGGGGESRVPMTDLGQGQSTLTWPRAICCDQNQQINKALLLSETNHCTFSRAHALSLSRVVALTKWWNKLSWSYNVHTIPPRCFMVFLTLVSSKYEKSSLTEEFLVFEFPTKLRIKTVPKHHCLLYKSLHPFQH